MIANHIMNSDEVHVLMSHRPPSASAAYWGTARPPPGSGSAIPLCLPNVVKPIINEFCLPTICGYFGGWFVIGFTTLIEKEPCKSF